MNNISPKIISIFLILATTLLVFGCTTSGQLGGTGSTTSQTNTTQTTTPELFANSSDAANAYQIIPGPINDTTQAALAGFTLGQVPKANGSIDVTIDSTEYNLHTTITVPKGNSLYIFERYLGDDKDNAESNLKDDHFILVDDKGYIVQKWPQ